MATATAKKSATATATATATAARKKRESKVDPDESRNQKFVRLANARVSTAVKKIYQIGNLGGAGYESTADQRDKIAKVLQDAVESAISRLNKDQAKPSTFQL